MDPLPLMDAGTHLGCTHSGQMAIHKMQNMVRYSVVIPRAFCGVFVFASRASPIPNPSAFGSQMGAPSIQGLTQQKGILCLSKSWAEGVDIIAVSLLYHIFWLSLTNIACCIKDPNKAKDKLPCPNPWQIMTLPQVSSPR